MLWWLKLTRKTVIAVRKGRATCEKGRVPNRALGEIEQALSQAGVSSGAIHESEGDRYGFSGIIPASLHQRLRNILVSP